MAVILIVTNSDDGAHTDEVSRHIIKLGSQVIRLNSDDLSTGRQRLTVTPSGPLILSTKESTFDLQAVDAVWHRRANVFGSSVEDPGQKKHLEAELKEVLEALVCLLAHKRWLNRPDKMQIASRKIYQLHLAQQVGLTVPETIVTADPIIATHFANQGPTVFKTLSKPQLVVDGELHFIPTTLLTEEHLDRVELIGEQHVLLQRFIDKRSEIRVTCIGAELFAAEQVPRDRGEGRNVTDWRVLQQRGRSEYVPIQLDPTVAAHLLEMLELLGLRFATFDLAIDQSGTCFFLELNPNGQWFGYTDEIGMPAALAMARLLVFDESGAMT